MKTLRHAARGRSPAQALLKRGVPDANVKREDSMDYRDDYDRDRRYRGQGYYGREDRGFFERAGDEVRSWFGDEDAQRRRERDERDEPRGWGGPSRSWS